MPNVVNVAIHAEYEKLFAGTVDGLFVQPLGLSVEDVDAFREKLAKDKLRMQVLKGSLAQRVLAARGLVGLDEVFKGPSAIIVAEEGQDVDSAALAASRTLAAWRKESGKDLPAIKGGVLEGQVLDRKAAGLLEKMPTRRDLQARLAGQIVGPGRRLGGQVVAAGGRVAGAIRSHITNLEKKAG